MKKIGFVLVKEYGIVAEEKKERDPYLIMCDRDLYPVNSSEFLSEIEKNISRKIKDKAVGVKSIRIMYDGTSLSKDALQGSKMKGVEVSDTVIVEIKF